MAQDGAGTEGTQTALPHLCRSDADGDRRLDRRDCRPLAPHAAGTPEDAPSGLHLWRHRGETRRSVPVSIAAGLAGELRDIAPAESQFPKNRTGAEILAVLNRADQEARDGSWKALRLRAAVYCFAYTGARRNEILGAQRADVDLERRVLSITSNERRPLKTSASEAELPMTRQLTDVMTDWIACCDSSWLFPHRFRYGPWLYGPNGAKALDQVRGLGERAGVPRLTILAFRHTFGTLAGRWGFGQLLLQSWLRHALLQTQESYRHRDLYQLMLVADQIRYD